MYEEINDSGEGEADDVIDENPDIEEGVESSWSEFSDESVTINYYIHPVNEYENTNWKVYENYMESGGYDDPVCFGEVCKGQPTAKGRKNTEKSKETEKRPTAGKGQTTVVEKPESWQIVNKNSDMDSNEYEIPLRADKVLTYDIISNSPKETLLFLN